MTEPDTRVSLQIGDQRYTGWKAITIGTGIEQLAGQFELSCADRWAIHDEKRPILAGLSCTVSLYGAPIITGFIDEVSPRYAPGEHALVIRGRDSTGDLVDCAAQTDGQGWEGRTLLQVATDICKPFGIPVTLGGSGGAAYAGTIFRRQAVNPGETAMEVLSRAARLRGFLLVSDANGGLLITRAGARRAIRELRLGRDILAGSLTDSQAERFNTYRIVGQDDEGLYADFEAQAQQVLAVATDPEIRKARVTVIDATDAADAGSARQLALWTAANRKARGYRAELTVRGWLDGSTPWQPNTLVRVDDAWLGLAGVYLIAQVQFSIDDEGGEVTTLSITPRDAYVPEPLQERAEDDA